MVILVLGSRGNLCIFVLYSHRCIFFCFKNSFASNFCTELKPSFGIRVVSVQGDAFTAEGFDQACGRPCYHGRSTGSILAVKEDGE